jgi:hypothetical protein
MTQLDLLPTTNGPGFKVGQTVSIYAGITGSVLKVDATIIRVSTTGRVLTVKRSDYRTASKFYLNASGWKFVQNPGAGIGGAIYNDYIRARG